MTSSSSSSSPEISNAHHSGLDHFSFKYASQDEVLEDLSSRFILNLPDEELESVERICFQVEQAHWFYEDFIREENPRYPSLPLKKFSAMLFNACPLLRQWSHDHEQAFNTFMQYKTRVPVCGAIMLNDTWEKCVLVKGWKSSSGWGFPKGKINQAEEEHHCAIREVLEETGYDLTDQLRPEDRIELSIKEQRITLYIVGGVPEDYHFQTRTRKEISKIEWFTLSDLPTWKRNKAVPGKFYLISPFVPRLKEFINQRKVNRKVNPRKAPKVIHTPSDHALYTRDASGGLSTNLAQDSYVAIGRDPDVPGSSSQSSSADNGGPYTPSPEYNQAQPITTSEDAKDDLGESIDPHFARLLSALSLSASKPPVLSESHNSVSSSTPVPAPVDAIQPSEVEHTLEETTLSSKHLPETQQHLAPPGQMYPPVSKSLPASSILSSKPAFMRSSPLAKRSSTVNISPYLSSVAEPFSSGRRLKQLALLESVASESSLRDLPMPNHRGVAMTSQPQITPGAAYLPSPSVPPISVGMAMTRPPYLPHLPGSVQGPLPQTFGRSYPPPPTDPFQVRPRTSNAAFPPSMTLHSHTPHAMSMHQTQLLTLMGGPNVGPQQPAPRPYHLGSAHFNPLAPPPHRQGSQPLRAMPPAISHFDSGLSASQYSLGSQATQGFPHAANKGHLLSMFNTNSTLTADPTRPNYSSGSPASNMLPPGVLNGITHR